MSCSSDEQSDKECPLCMETFEIDDVNFYPCKCEYQICRFCWHRIRTDENGLCPACRQPYPEDPVNFKPLSTADVQKIKSEKKMKAQAERQRISESRKHLSTYRVLQKNLVYVVGLSSRVADPEVLKRPEYFGRFGKISKIVVGTTTNVLPQLVPTHTAYVTYTKIEEALKAIVGVNNAALDGRLVKASLGTTKYCSSFLRSQLCYKPECMYLHEIADSDISFTKDDMHMGKHAEYEKRLIDTVLAPKSTQFSIPHTPVATVPPTPRQPSVITQTTARQTSSEERQQAWLAKNGWDSEGTGGAKLPDFDDMPTIEQANRQQQLLQEKTKLEKKKAGASASDKENDDTRLAGEIEKYRDEKEREERERREREEIERQRLRRSLEAEEERIRLEKEVATALERERMEMERLEKEKIERERLEAEAIRREKEESEQRERDRLESERVEREAAATREPSPPLTDLEPLSSISESSFIGALSSALPTTTSQTSRLHSWTKGTQENLLFDSPINAPAPVTSWQALLGLTPSEPPLSPSFADNVSHQPVHTLFGTQNVVNVQQPVQKASQQPLYSRTPAITTPPPGLNGFISDADDDLGFDPFSESAKGLADLLEEERRFHHSVQHSHSPFSHSHMPFSSVQHAAAFQQHAQTIAAQQVYMQQMAAMQVQQVHHLAQQREREREQTLNGLGESWMRNMHQLERTSNAPSQHFNLQQSQRQHIDVFGCNGFDSHHPSSPHNGYAPPPGLGLPQQRSMQSHQSHQGQHSHQSHVHGMGQQQNHPVSQGQTAQKPASLTEWQEGLKALLPNVNIRFAIDMEQQQPTQYTAQQQQQPQSRWPHSSTSHNGQHVNPASLFCENRNDQMTSGRVMPHIPPPPGFSIHTNR